MRSMRGIEELHPYRVQNNRVLGHANPARWAGLRTGRPSACERRTLKGCHSPAQGVTLG
jgi:hypothetical protein